MPHIVNDEKLFQFTANVFQSFGISKENAKICADNLVIADLRGIPSHGVARLQRYVNGMKTGVILPLSEPEVVRDFASNATVDGHAGLGQIVAHYSTRLAIDKANKSGVGIVAVRNSNHFGIAGYYSEMMLKEGMLGVSLTNSAPLVVPTFGTEMIVGTNPISLTAPTKRNRPFFLDMATSVVPRGKLEVYNREEKSMPKGWAVDAKGAVTTNAGHVLDNMLNRVGGGILPLGGSGEVFSGYKGYGMAMIVDILSGVLSGGAYANLVNKKVGGKPAPANVSHFFMALKIENFVDMETFTSSMDDFIDKLKLSSKADGEDRIFIHGEKEYERFEMNKAEGVPLQEKVFSALRVIGNECNVPFDL